MKKKHGMFIGFTVLLMAAMFTVAGCDTGTGGDPGDGNGDLPTTNGRFTLTGAGAYNRQYAYAQGTVSAGFIYGATGTVTEMRGIQIQNGTVELPMYFKSTTAAALTAYSGSDTITAQTIPDVGKMYSFQVWIMPTADPQGYIGTLGSHYIGWDTVTFTGGSVTKAVSEGTYY
ncbi:MAG: hypothetical protein LBJ31_12165 [Treponema sp.]|jgi:hypothetical protein|nr:hypothetical protein [Treponema sp.]